MQMLPAAQIGHQVCHQCQLDSATAPAPDICTGFELAAACTAALGLHNDLPQQQRTMGSLSTNGMLCCNMQHSSLCCLHAPLQAVKTYSQVKQQSSVNSPFFICDGVIALLCMQKSLLLHSGRHVARGCSLQLHDTLVQARSYG